MTDVSNSGMTLDNLEGRAVIGSDGEKLGTVADVYFDKDTRQPEWALVTTGLFGSKHSFVPITSASATSEGLSVNVTKDQVKDAPRLDDDGELSQDEEALLSRHYGLTYSEAPSDTGLPEGGAPRGRGPLGNDTSGPEIDEANVGAAMRGGDLTEEEHELTLSEEEVVVDKKVVPKERVRLDKDVVTEERPVSEEVRKEQIDVEGDVQEGK